MDEKQGHVAEIKTIKSLTDNEQADSSSTSVNQMKG